MKDNKGYTLFELLISIAIFSVVMLGIISIMNTTSAFYRGGQQEVRLQEEAQVAVNQVEELLIDLDDRISTNSNTAGARQYTVHKKDGSTYGLKQDGDKLMYQQIASGIDSGWVLMAEGVTDFEISGFTYSGGPQRDNGDNRVSVNLGVKNGKYEYTAKKDVYFRNAVENNIARTIPQSSSSTSVGSQDHYDFEYTIRRGEKLNLFSEFNIVSDAYFFSESSLNVNDYFEFIDQTTNSTTGITNNVIRLKGSLASMYSQKLTQAGKLGVEGKDPDGEDVRVLLLVDEVKVNPDTINIFQFTVNHPTNHGSPKWVDYKGIDFRGINNLNYDVLLFRDVNGNHKYDDGIDQKFENSERLNCAFDNHGRLMSYDVNSLVNKGYITATINMGVRVCDNTGFLQVYQWNDKCENGIAFFDAGDKYMRITIRSGTNNITSEPLYLQCFAHRGGF